MAKRVPSADPKNLEAQAAKLYWRRLFGDEFRRDRERPDENALLNYGYAVVRAATARAIVVTGLHLGFGLYHKNQYNPFPLADDLMEPLRPFIDLRVFAVTRSGENDAGTAEERSFPLDRETKARLLGTLEDDCLFNGRKLPLMAAVGYCAANVKQFITGETDRVYFPSL
jgi:CRISPR-associated protein Cas1